MKLKTIKSIKSYSDFKIGQLIQFENKQYKVFEIEKLKGGIKEYKCIELK